MKNSRAGWSAQALWYVLWSAMLVVSATSPLFHSSIFSSNWGLGFSVLLSGIAGQQILRGVKFLRRREAALSAVLLIVFCMGQGVQRLRSMGGAPIVSRGADFSAYYVAGKLVSGRPTQSLYQLPLFADGRMNLNAENSEFPGWHDVAMSNHVPYSAPFIYPPFFAVLMKPLAHLSFASAFVAWNAMTVLLVAAAVLLSLNLAGVRVDGRLALILGVGLLSYYPLIDDLLFGQIGGVILFLFASGVWLLSKNRVWPSALCFAAATLIKLTPVLAVPVLIFHRRWKWLMAYVVWMASLLSFSVWQAGWSMHQQFWHEVLPSIACGAAVCQNSSIMAFVQELFLGHVPLSGHPPLTIPPYACAVSRYVSFAVYTLMLVRLYLRRRDGLVVRDLVVMALLGIVVSPISWWHHYTVGLLPFLYFWGKMPEKGNRMLLVLFLAVATNVVGILRIPLENHVAQLVFAAIMPGLTIAVAFMQLAPGRQLPAKSLEPDCGVVFSN